MSQRFTHLNPKGWPFCPKCGEDSIISDHKWETTPFGISVDSCQKERLAILGSLKCQACGHMIHADPILKTMIVPVDPKDQFMKSIASPYCSEGLYGGERFRRIAELAFAFQNGYFHAKQQSKDKTT